MSTKEKVLTLFQENRGLYFSGQEMARQLNVSRAAVWKAVEALRQDGYPIDAVTNKGYCLSEQADILSAAGISGYMGSSDLVLEVVDAVPSTNALVGERAADGAQEGYVLLANGQTAGRGRGGRAFYSPKETGVYLSVLLRPKTAAVSITTMAAAAMCEAIGAVSGREARIKWVNDIFVDGKKVCGILTEGVFSMETGQLDYAVLGVGINAYCPIKGFPEDLREIAGPIFQAPGGDQKNRLIAFFLQRFFHYYRSDNPAEYVQSYRRHSMVIGKRITVVLPHEERQALAVDMDDQCRLIVEYADGRREVLSYGEIRIRI